MTIFGITISLAIVGFIAGFLCSMPIGGPVSIIVASNALKGKLDFCRKTAIGGAVVVFFYVFIAMYGLTRFYNLYAPYIAYVILIGTLFLFLIGIRIAFTRLKIDPEESTITKKELNKGGFRTGFMVNLINPTLFIGWLMISFFFISLASSYGIDMGGLDEILNENISNLENYSIGENKIADSTASLPAKTDGFLWLLSGFYALGLSLGSISWYYIFSKWLVNNRKRIKSSMLNVLFPILGTILVVFGIVLIFKALAMLNIL